MYEAAGDGATWAAGRAKQEHRAEALAAITEAGPARPSPAWHARPRVLARPSCLRARVRVACGGLRSLAVACGCLRLLAVARGACVLASLARLRAYVLACLLVLVYLCTSFATVKPLLLMSVLLRLALMLGVTWRVLVPRLHIRASGDSAEAVDVFRQFANPSKDDTEALEAPGRNPPTKDRFPLPFRSQTPPREAAWRDLHT